MHILKLHQADAYFEEALELMHILKLHQADAYFERHAKHSFRPLYPSVESVMELLRTKKVPLPADKEAAAAALAVEPKSRPNKRKAPSADDASTVTPVMIVIPNP
jgi:hypothetical protein